MKATALFFLALLSSFLMFILPNPAAAEISREKTAQVMLYNQGYYSGEIDGDWDEETSNATRKFQKEQHVHEDGVLSEALLDALWTAREKRYNRRPPEDKTPYKADLSRAACASRNARTAPYREKYEIVQSTNPRYVFLKERSSGREICRFDLAGLDGLGEEWRIPHMIAAAWAPSGDAILFGVSLPCSYAAGSILEMLLFDLNGRILLDVIVSTDCGYDDLEEYFNSVGFSENGKKIFAAIDVVDENFSWDISHLAGRIQGKKVGRIRITQTLLNNLGYSCGAIDGMMGPQTRKALKAFCREIGLPYAGKLTEELLLKMWEIEGILYSNRENIKGTLCYVIRPDMYISYVAVSPNGKTILLEEEGGQVGGTDHIVKLWSLPQGTFLHDLSNEKSDGDWERHPAPWCAAQYSPDGNVVVTGSEQGYVRWWDVATGKILCTTKGEEFPLPVTSVAYSPDGQRVFSSRKTCDFPEDEVYGYIWHRGKRKSKCFLEKAFTTNEWMWLSNASFSPDGTKLLFDMINGVGVMDGMTGEIISHYENYNRGIFSSTGENIALVLGEKDDKPLPALLLDGSGRKTLHTLEGHGGVVTSAAFSADGKRLVTGSSDGTAKLWDTRTGRCLFTFKGHDGKVLDVDISPDGSKMVTGSSDGTARLWSLREKKLISFLPSYFGEVFFVGFSPQGDSVITANHNTVRVFDAQ